MELAYDLIKIKKPIKCKNILLLKNLKLSKYVKEYDHKKFYSLINSKKYINSCKSFLEELFDTKGCDKELPLIVLKSYYITNYKKYVFGDELSCTESRLLLAAGILTNILNKITKLHNKKISKRRHNKLIDAIDYYLAIYNIWASKSRLVRLEEIFNDIKEKYTILKYSHDSESQNESINCINYKIVNMFLINPYFTVNILLENYYLVLASCSTYNIFWENVNVNIIDHERIFIIIVSLLRLRLINMLKIGKARKELYYMIDVEDIIKNIRYNKFTDSNKKKIIDIFYDKVRIISPKFTTDFDKDGVDVLKDLYDEIYV